MSRAPRRGARSHFDGIPPFRAGAVVLVVISALVYLGFTKHVPFTHGYRLKAAFASASSIRVGSPVRIAGVTVGKVTGVTGQSGTTAAVLTMELADRALPLHTDATAKIRPRIFLEGNFFVDLRPGTPSAPVLGEGKTLPVTQTATPVQFDQVLTALPRDIRARLQQLVDGYGTALTHRPSAAEDVGQDSRVRGVTAASALNRSSRLAGPALRDAAIVSEAALGNQPHDLRRLIAGLGRVSHALDTREQALGDLVGGLDTTLGAFAARSAEVRASVRRLGPTVEHADAALASLAAALPSTRAFAREVLPGLRETPATIAAAFPWMAQVRGLLSNAELRGLVSELRPATGDLAGVIDGLVGLLPRLDLVARCATDVVLPAGNIKIDDGPRSVGVENYKELFYALVGLAGESQNFDGNGPYVRFQPGGGAETISAPSGQGPLGQAFGSAIAKPLGTRPAYPRAKPPYVSDQPCYRQGVPDLNAAPTGAAEPSTP